MLTWAIKTESWAWILTFPCFQRKSFQISVKAKQSSSKLVPKKQLVLLTPFFHQVYTDQLTEKQFSSAYQHHTACGVTGFTILQVTSVRDQQADAIYPADMQTDLPTGGGGKTSLVG